MKKTNFAIGLIFLIVLTIIIYSIFGFEVTIIFLIIDFSVGVSYQFSKINKDHDLEEIKHPGFALRIPKDSKEDSIIILQAECPIHKKRLDEYENELGQRFGIKTIIIPVSLKFDKVLTQEDYKKIMEEVKENKND